MIVDVVTDAIFVVWYLACKTNQSNVHFSANIELSWNKKKKNVKCKYRNKRINWPIRCRYRTVVPLGVWPAEVNSRQVHISFTWRKLCFGDFGLSDRFDLANFEMSSLESCYRGGLAATPDPATYYRRKYLCASPSGGGKGKRHPGKAILAGMALVLMSSNFSNLSL